ncbi:uncharacterized protein DS421_13g420300 [Arachis hypogaea]|nr:uncharacterized protein DS421_13g420300 [Arachis hypogaea]
MHAVAEGGHCVCVPQQDCMRACGDGGTTSMSAAVCGRGHYVRGCGSGRGRYVRPAGVEWRRVRAAMVGSNGSGAHIDVEKGIKLCVMVFFTMYVRLMG